MRCYRIRFSDLAVVECRARNSVPSKVGTDVPSSSGKKDKELLDALLYGVKFKGCAISSVEIEEMKRLASKS